VRAGIAPFRANDWGPQEKETPMFEWGWIHWVLLVLLVVLIVVFFIVRKKQQQSQ
jgi:apolipoprotein N-acyltransferase